MANNRFGELPQRIAPLHPADLGDRQEPGRGPRGGRRIQGLTVPGERVYLWISNRSGLAFTTGRPSASRYFTPTYFFHNPKILARLFPVWWKDMEDSKPRIVADCGAPDMPWLFRGTASRVGLPGQDAGVWWDAEWQQRLATLEGKYEWLFTDASQGCAIYRRR